MELVVLNVCLQKKTNRNINMYIGPIVFFPVRPSAFSHIVSSVLMSDSAGTYQIIATIIVAQKFSDCWSNMLIGLRHF